MDEVRERLWENLHTFIRALDQTTAWPLVHEIGELLVQGRLSNWRLRERLMSALPDLVDGMIAASRGRYLVVSLLQVGLVDAVSAVRIAAIQSVVPVYAATRRQEDVEARDALDQVLIAMSTHTRYRQRQTFVWTMESFLDHDYDHELTVARCIPHLLPLNGDPVVEVRLALAKVVARFLAPDGLCPVYVDAPKDLQTMATSLNEDDSFDIRALIAPVYPHAVIPRRPSAAPSPATSGSPRPLTRRTSSMGTAFSTSSARSTGSASPSSEVPGTASAESPPELALQLQHVPSPRANPQVLRGYELGGYAFPAEIREDQAAEAAAEISSGRPDPFEWFEPTTGHDHFADGFEPTAGLELSNTTKAALATTPSAEAAAMTPRAAETGSGGQDSYFPQVDPPQPQPQPHPETEGQPWTQEGPGDYVSVNNGARKDAESAKKTSPTTAAIA